jgi:hypothetical protein
MAASKHLDVWLGRTRKQLADSGRIPQVAAVLAGEDGTAAADWEQTLRAILDGEQSPDLDLLTRIDAILSGASRKDGAPAACPQPRQMDFFATAVVLPALLAQAFC